MRPSAPRTLPPQPGAPQPPPAPWFETSSTCDRRNYRRRPLSTRGEHRATSATPFSPPRLPETRKHGGVPTVEAVIARSPSAPALSPPLATPLLPLPLLVWWLNLGTRGPGWRRWRRRRGDPGGLGPKWPLLWPRRGGGRGVPCRGRCLRRQSLPRYRPGIKILPCVEGKRVRVIVGS